MPLQDFLASLFGLNDPYKDDREKLREQIARMTYDPYADTQPARDQLREQIARMEQPQFQPDPNSPWAPSVQKFVANFPQEALAPNLRRTGDGASLDQSLGVDESGMSMHDRAQAAIAAREASEKAQEKKAAEDAKRQADLDKLIAAGMQASGQRDFLRGTTPLVEDYESGIAIGGDPNRGRDEILARIRAQAAVKGKRGSLKGGTPTEEQYASGLTPGGGGLTFSNRTPQQEQELISQLRGVADEQKLRDAQWDVDLARQRRQPEAQKSAEETLINLQAQDFAMKQQKLQEAFINKSLDSGGKVPFEKAMQAEAMGFKVPWEIKGLDPQTFDREIGDLLSRTDADLNKAEQLMQSGAPPDAYESIAGYSRYMQSKINEVKALVNSGKMTRDEGIKYLRQIAAAEAEASGALRYYQMFSGQGQQPQVGE